VALEEDTGGPRDESHCMPALLGSNESPDGGSRSCETSEVGRALFSPIHDPVPVCCRQRYSTWIVLGIGGLGLGYVSPCYPISLKLLRSSGHSRDNNDFYERETLQRHVFVVFVGSPLSRGRRNNVNKKNVKTVCVLCHHVKE
jgi:hypothetical protein